MLPSSTQPLSLALRLTGISASPMTQQLQNKKDWMAQRIWQNGSYVLLVVQQHIQEGIDLLFFFLEVGRKTNILDAFKTKEGDFSP